MRIGQLARRLGIPPSDISGFLADNNIESESGTNSRLTEEVVVTIIKRFAPEKLSEIIQAPEVVQAPAPVVVIEEQSVSEEPAPMAELPVEETEEPVAPLEVIRVSKVELQGLKVVGKIELPQPKKKAEEEQTDSEPANPEQEPTPQRPPRKEFQKRNDRRDQREWKNPMEQKRLQEAREAERKKREEAERVKEKRTNHYYSKVKSVPTKAARKVEEQTVVEELDMKEPPKTIIGKFFRWLRT